MFHVLSLFLLLRRSSLTVMAAAAKESKAEESEAVKIANEWFRWFSLAAWDIGEGEHAYFRYTGSRKHGVTAVVDGQMCFVSVESGTVTAHTLEAVKSEGGVLCRAAYGVTDWLPRMYGVGNFVLRDSATNISRRTRMALRKPVTTDAATWAVGICISVEQGGHIMAGGQHGVVFQIENEYRLYTVVDWCVVRYALWEFFSIHKVTTLSYVANTALSPSDQHKAIAICENAISIGSKDWSLIGYKSKEFCEALRRGVIPVPNPIHTLSDKHSDPLISLFRDILKATAEADALTSLKWSSLKNGSDVDVFNSTKNQQNHVLWNFVQGRFRSEFLAKYAVTRAVFTKRSDPIVNTFIALHQWEIRSRANNRQLRVDVTHGGDNDATDAINVLKSMFEENIPAGGNQPYARIVFVWLGVPMKDVESVCRDGPRDFRTTDPGYFGAGVYFAREAVCAARYSRPDKEGLRAVILFAVSVSQAYPVTVGVDYRTDVEEADVHPVMHGFSKFYNPSPLSAVALVPRCDAHFIPVRKYGMVHPRTNLATPRNLDYQATPVATAEFHELVITSHFRCTPIATVYFTGND